MESYDKIVIGPEQMDTSSSSTTKKSKRDPMSRIHKILRLILKLAQVDAYDLNFQVKNDAGEPIPRSDVGRLTLQALSPGRMIIGEDEFIRMLFKAGIYPEEIVNEQYRAKLSQLYSKSRTTESITRRPSQIIPKPAVPPQVIPVKPPQIVEERQMPILEPADTQTFVSYRKRTAPEDYELDPYTSPPVPTKRMKRSYDDIYDDDDDDDKTIITGPWETLSDDD